MITATRFFEIDAAHRVTYHGSKCRSLHGHRYKFEATVGAEKLYADGEQEGMVLDFGFIKKVMVDIIDHLLDHGMIMWVEDPVVPVAYPEVDLNEARKTIRLTGCSFYSRHICASGKLLLVPFVPTAENMARFFFELMDNEIRKNYAAFMVKLRIYETPNCYADYPNTLVINFNNEYHEGCLREEKICCNTLKNSTSLEHHCPNTGKNQRSSNRSRLH